MAHPPPKSPPPKSSPGTRANNQLKILGGATVTTTVPDNLHLVTVPASDGASADGYVDERTNSGQFFSWTSSICTFTVSSQAPGDYNNPGSANGGTNGTWIVDPTDGTNTLIVASTNGGCFGLFNQGDPIEFAGTYNLSATGPTISSP